jgi:hypothetical protein
MRNHVFLAAVVFGAGALTVVPLDVQAQDSVIVETFAATTYLNGGIGEQEQATMHRLAKEFPLRLTFSERKGGEFIADVPVAISDMHGNSVFELTKAGPMLDVVLPNGKYKVSARFKGLTESQDVTLSGKEGKELSFHWSGK